MPFRSKSQLRACFAGQLPGVDCREWLQKTADIGCLPEKSSSSPPRKCRPQRKDEKIVGKVKVGPRGGRYFDIRQDTDKVRVYLPKSKKK